jgi:hypothetical protein
MQTRYRRSSREVVGNFSRRPECNRQLTGCILLKSRKLHCGSLVSPNRTLVLVEFQMVAHVQMVAGFSSVATVVSRMQDVPIVMRIFVAF